MVNSGWLAEGARTCRRLPVDQTSYDWPCAREDHPWNASKQIWMSVAENNINVGLYDHQATHSVIALLLMSERPLRRGVVAMLIDSGCHGHEEPQSRKW